ncbi:MAG TPA: peptidylprolyl isomerase [Burkholderiales bacterium]|nr:peptidylprolyl isomerase [Burkholderiales bacterium]
MRLKTSKLLLVAVSSFAVFTLCHAQDAAKAAPKSGIAVTVNGKAIPQSQLDLLARERAAQGQADTEELRKNLRDELINRELLAQEAAKNSLDKNPEVATQIEFARQTVLVRAYLQDYLKTHPVSEEVLKAGYDKITSQLGDKEYHARHILVEKEAEAKDIIAQLKKGAKFEKLAAEKSKDPGSRAKGGDLDWAPPANYVKPFADALTKLKKGQYTQTPVETQFGWHVVKLEDVRPLKIPPFENVKSNLQQREQQQQLEKYVGELRTKAKIE